jgi:hypothetical protein
MPPPSPIHRDPDLDGDDYGCVGRNARKANAAIAKLVTESRDRLNAGEFGDGDELVYFVRARLERLSKQYDCGSCDTIVKENVFAALHDAVEKAGIEPIEQIEIYGW